MGSMADAMNDGPYKDQCRRGNPVWNTQVTAETKVAKKRRYPLQYTVDNGNFSFQIAGMVSQYQPQGLLRFTSGLLVQV